MQCPFKFQYTIQQGDTLYQIAKFYQTSVHTLLSENPGVVATNLLPGTQITICPGSNFFVPGRPMPPTTPQPPIGTIPPTTPMPFSRGAESRSQNPSNMMNNSYGNTNGMYQNDDMSGFCNWCSTLPTGMNPPIEPAPPIGTLPTGTNPPVQPVPPIGTLPTGTNPPVQPVPPIGTLPTGTNPPERSACDSKMDLNNQMRLAWEQHIYWTRMLMISMVEGLQDDAAVTQRVLQNPGDIAKVFSNYYSPDVPVRLTELLTDHLQIAARLMNAIRNGSDQEIEAINQQWYDNADQFVNYLVTLNPYYDVERLREMMYHHLELMKQELNMRLEGEYPEEIMAFDASEQAVLEMADMLSQGIIDQLPEYFQ